MTAGDAGGTGGTGGGGGVGGTGGWRFSAPLADALTGSLALVAVAGVSTASAGAEGGSPSLPDSSVPAGSPLDGSFYSYLSRRVRLRLWRVP